jgi:YHS domain-containing protein
MKSIRVGVALLCCLGIGAFAQAAEPPAAQQAAPHHMPDQPAQAASPHAGHEMPMQGGHGMMGGGMHGMMMNCGMHKNMETMLSVMKDIIATQDALLKGVSDTEKAALQTKLAGATKTLDTLQAQPMQCPMMQQMHGGQSSMHQGHQMGASSPAAAAKVAMAKDPICGMDVDPMKAQAAGLALEYQGKTYYFCSEHCKQEFTKNPKP